MIVILQAKTQKRPLAWEQVARMDFKLALVLWVNLVYHVFFIYKENLIVY